jgi:hypothetical protein
MTCLAASDAMLATKVYKSTEDEVNTWADFFSEVIVSASKVKPLAPDNIMQSLPSLLNNLNAKFNLCDRGDGEPDADASGSIVKKEGAANATGIIVPSSAGTKTSSIVSVESLYGLEDEDMTKELQILSHSLDAYVLGNLKVDLPFLASFNAHLSTFVQVKVADRGLSHIMLDTTQKDPKPVASEVVEGIALHFVGSICTAGLPGSIKCMRAFGTDYFISGDKCKSVTDPIFDPAWMVQVVSAEKATFEFEMCTVYFNWPEGMELPDFDEKFYKDHEPEVHNVSCDVRVEIERKDPLDDGDDDTDPITIYWVMTIPALVPKPEYLSQKGVIITRPPLDAEVPKFSKKRVQSSGEEVVSAISVKKAVSMLGVQAARAQAERAVLQCTAKGGKGDPSLPEVQSAAKLCKDLSKRAKHLLK